MKNNKKENSPAAVEEKTDGGDCILHCIPLD